MRKYICERLKGKPKSIYDDIPIVEKKEFNTLKEAIHFLNETRKNDSYDDYWVLS